MSCGGALAFGRHAAAQSVYKTLFGANDFPPPSYPHTRFQPTAGNLITPLNFLADYSAFLQLLLTKTFHFSKGRQAKPTQLHTHTHTNSICLICYSNSLGCTLSAKKEKEKSFTQSCGKICLVCECHGVNTILTQRTRRVCDFGTRE
jgi:hypothetical protein